MFTTLTILLLSLLASTHASATVDIQPLPFNLDTNLWSPFTTLAPMTPFPSTPTPSPAAEAEVGILPVLDANMNPDLKRQVTGQGAATAPPPVTQMSPVTTYYANSYIGGSFVQVPIVYTQTFAFVPDQWAAPFSGEIGLGTIKGTIGVVKSKRGLPTQAPLAEGGARMDAENAEQAGFPLMEKPRQAGTNIKAEVVALMSKEKEEIMEELASQSHSLSSVEEAVEPSNKAKSTSAETGLANHASLVSRTGPMVIFFTGIITIYLS